MTGALTLAVAALAADAPCTGPDAERWTSDRLADRAVAAAACSACPSSAHTRCATAAAGERWHVWAGRDLTSATNAALAAHRAPKVAA